MKLSKIKPNPNNPRLVKDDKFSKLVESLKSFGEKMMPLRPMVIDENNILLGGNMRYKALKELGYKEVPDTWVKQVLDLTEEEKQEFIIKDNVGFGAWDWDTLANEWDTDNLENWGLEVWNTETENIDYSLLDDADLDGELGEMTSNVKKAIQIEFNLEDYEEAKELVKFWRDNGTYVGSLLIEKLKHEKKIL